MRGKAEGSNFLHHIGWRCMGVVFKGIVKGWALRLHSGGGRLSWDSWFGGALHMHYWGVFINLDILASMSFRS